LSASTHLPRGGLLRDPVHVPRKHCARQPSAGHAGGVVPARVAPTNDRPSSRATLRVQGELRWSVRGGRHRYLGVTGRRGGPSTLGSAIRLARRHRGAVRLPRCQPRLDPGLVPRPGRRGPGASSGCARRPVTGCAPCLAAPVTPSCPAPTRAASTSTTTPATRRARSHARHLARANPASGGAGAVRLSRPRAVGPARRLLPCDCPSCRRARSPACSCVLTPSPIARIFFVTRSPNRATLDAVPVGQCRARPAWGELSRFARLGAVFGASSDVRKRGMGMEC